MVTDSGSAKLQVVVYQMKKSHSSSYILRQSKSLLTKELISNMEEASTSSITKFQEKHHMGNQWSTARHINYFTQATTLILQTLELKLSICQKTLPQREGWTLTSLCLYKIACKNKIKKPVNLLISLFIVLQIRKIW